MSNYTKNQYTDDKNNSWSIVFDLIRDKDEVLDVGCSSGNFGAELIKRKQCVVDGIDIDAKDIELAKKQLRNAYVIDVEKDELTKLNKKYDAILMMDVIEHLVDPVGALSKLRALLKPHGVIVFSIPNMAHVSVRLALLGGEFTYTQTGLLDKTHLHFYTGEEIKRIFTESDYSITTFNNTSVSYPASLYDKKLQKLGLSIQDKKKFLETIASSHGNVYQYIGTAKPAKGVVKQSDAPMVNPHEKDFQIIDETIVTYQKNIELLEAEVKDLQSQLRAIQNSRAWKLARKAGAIKAKARGRS